MEHSVEALNEGGALKRVPSRNLDKPKEGKEHSSKFSLFKKGWCLSVRPVFLADELSFQVIIIWVFLPVTAMARFPTNQIQPGKRL